MTTDSITMPRRKKSLILKVVAGSLVCLLLFRVDFLGLLTWQFLSESLSADRSGDMSCTGRGCLQRRAGDRLSFIRQIVDQEPGEDNLHRVDGEQELECDSQPKLKSTIRLPSPRTVQCVRSPTSRAACTVAREMYGDVARVAEHNSCSQQTWKDHCHTQLSEGQFHVHCNMSACNREKKIHLGVFNQQAAEYRWTAFDSASALESAIQDLTLRDNPGYCIVSCVVEKSYNSKFSSPLFEELGVRVRHPQLVNLPPHVAKTNQKKNLIDFNMVFIDSTSRHHLFRTLPKSVKVLEEFAEGGSKFNFGEKPVVLDYSLVQAVRSRTYETLETLFSGYINPFEKTFGVQAMPNKALKTQALLKPLQRLGYKTLWLEDLCPLWEWGLSKDLLVYEKDLDRNNLLKNLKAALDEAGIDSIGNTLSSCLLLNSNGVPDPFHGPDKICFNGRHHHEYQFDYLTMFQETMSWKNQSFFTFLETNIGHEQNGIRIAQLDSKLAEFLNYVKSMTNTITVILSDHGNAYGRYFDRSSEGRVELYQPFMFIIIPPAVQHVIKEANMRNLLENQQKLVSVLDLHYTFQHLINLLQSSSLAKPGVSPRKTPGLANELEYTETVFNFNQQFHVTKQGLMGNISESRSCSIMPRIMPNVCICQGYESKKSKVTFYYILALFTIGELNNEIQRQRRSKAKAGSGGFGHCVMLKLSSEPVKNIQENQIQGGSNSIGMDIHISTSIQRQAEVFFVGLTINHGSQGKLLLQNYDRVSIYGNYAVCADKHVPLSLCICDIDSSGSNVSGNSVLYNHTYKFNTDTKHLNDAWKQFESPKLRTIAQTIIHKDLEVEVKELEVGGAKCLGVVMQSNDAGVVVQVLSVCHDIVNLVADLRTAGLVLSSTSKVEQTIYPGDVKFLVAGVTKDDGTQWKWDVQLSYRIVKT